MVCCVNGSCLVDQGWYILNMIKDLSLLLLIGFVWGYYLGKHDQKKKIKEERKTRRKVRRHENNSHNQED
jgi:hypothetical protein